MKKEMAKTYDPTAVEDRLYAMWLERGYFRAEADTSKKPFTIVMPPPNITGQLHMGHAFDCTLQDILIRWKRMDGYNALWIPGTDHASISTEVRIVNKMAEEGLTKADVGRDGFLKRAWEWREEYGGRILKQLRKFGSSCDWSRERFTMDEGLSKAVLEVFVRLYDKGLIYRGEKLINWCPKCRTTISDAEVNHVDRESWFYYFKYPIEGTDEFLTFATTRPETMLGDTAVAVNPNDERYAKFVGKAAVMPVTGVKMPVIADEYVDMEFGTGVVKITPAHDPNDFEVGERHNLKRVNIMNDDGTINENGGAYAGMDRYEAREKIVSDFEKLGLFMRKEEIRNAVGVHERCQTVVEPLIKLQWFVKMDRLAKPAIEAYTSKKLRIIPERFGKIYLNWLENIRDWCVSRQLWWGHRIPAYYCECGFTVVSRERPEKCPECGGSALTQDDDTLDTWFSSALWPFSTLGWPDETPELKCFYPTDVLVTSYDIIFFWVVRMVFSGIEHMGEQPFKDVFIHGLIRDSLGRKMSKSLDNGVDPLEVIEKHGADALRLTIVTGNSPGADSRYYPEKVEASGHFLNKLWNASRFVLMNVGDDDVEKPGELTPADKWILSKANALITKTNAHMNAYELGMAVSGIHDFIWDEYCDWYIEMVKVRLRDDETKSAALWTLKRALTIALKLLHPYMPFITEEIFQSLRPEEESLMISAWPRYDENFNFPKEEKEIELIKEAVRGVRALRSDMNAPPSKKVHVTVVSKNRETRRVFEDGRAFFAMLAAASDVEIVSEKSAEGCVTIVVPDAVVYMSAAELTDREAEIKRLEKEREKLAFEVTRVKGMLGNEGFVKKAPAALIKEQEEKMGKYSSMLDSVEAQIKSLRLNAP
ncbi:MAG: valine--tRNA ligase [Clostridiales bacterium]|jgi:valyl-tRNA synthetase|nr:valine--tRNA ligase [Clostridiales bacterium]